MTIDTVNAPMEIRLRSDKKSLSVAFSAMDIYEFPAEFLRVESPSAEVKGHGAGEKKIVGGKKDVAISNLEPVGNYAVKITFDDGHDTGLYSWKCLKDLGENMDELWRLYMQGLKETGQSRDA